jgi:RNA polymerase sigma factor (sigma-70 family)
MQESDDIELLREYAERSSERAFATLVARHINKVYSVALRHSNSPHQAEEITHLVFVILARKARSLRHGVVLSGWLYQTARLTALTFIRSEIRRTRREQEAHMQSFSEQTEPEPWARMAPLLDAAIAELDAKDREAVVLRFFDGKSMKQVGDALSTSEDAAKKRVARAVEKLRHLFAQRGVVFPAAVLTSLISANSIQAAPAHLAASVATMVAAKGAAGGTSTLTLIKVLKLMAWTKAKIAAVTAAAVLLTAGTATVAVKTGGFGIWSNRPSWPPKNPSPEFVRAERLLKPMPPELLERLVRMSPPAMAKVLKRYSDMFPAAYEFFGSLPDERLDRFVSTGEVRMPVTELDLPQRAALEKWFDAVRQMARGGPPDWRDYKLVLSRMGAAQDLSNVDVGFTSPKRQVHIQFWVKQPGGKVEDVETAFALR